MTMSLTETLISCFSANWERIEQLAVSKTTGVKNKIDDTGIYSIPLSSFLKERRGSSITSDEHNKKFKIKG